MKTLLLLISAVVVTLGAAGCASHTSGARSSGYDSSRVVWSPWQQSVRLFLLTEHRISSVRHLSRSKRDPKKCAVIPMRCVAEASDLREAPHVNGKVPVHKKEKPKH